MKAIKFDGTGEVTVDLLGGYVAYVTSGGYHEVELWEDPRGNWKVSLDGSIDVYDEFGDAKGRFEEVVENL